MGINLGTNNSRNIGDSSLRLPTTPIFLRINDIYDGDESYVRAITTESPNVVLVRTSSIGNAANQLLYGEYGVKLIFGKVMTPLRNGKELLVRTHDDKTVRDKIQGIRVTESKGEETIIITTSRKKYELLLRGNDAEHASLKFMRNGYLDYNDPIPNGFFVCTYKDNERVTLTSKERLLVEATKGHMLLLDSSKDDKLKAIIAEAKKVVAIRKTEREKALILSLYVSYVLGGSDKDRIRKSEKDLKRVENEQAIATARGTFLPIGEFQFGVCIHKSVLYKYLADRTGIKCRLVEGVLFDREEAAADYRESAATNTPRRLDLPLENGEYGYHAWNVVQIEGEDLLLDVHHSPNELSRASNNHLRMKRRSVVGGIGGDSIMRSRKEIT